MKKYLSLLLCLMVVCCCFGCQSKQEPNDINGSAYFPNNSQTSTNTDYIGHDHSNHHHDEHH